MAAKRIKDKNADLDFEIGFFEGLLKKRPDYVPALTALGDAYTQRGYFEKGLEIDLRLSRMRPEDSLVHYNLACSYSLLERIDPALTSLKKAIDLGYKDFLYMHRDPDLENLRRDKRFQELFKELKR